MKFLEITGAWNKFFYIANPSAKDKKMIRKNDKVRHKRGEEGIAMADESDGNVMVKVKDSFQNWSIYEIEVKDTSEGEDEPSASG